jgi:hypothetical protein
MKSVHNEWQTHDDRPYPYRARYCWRHRDWRAGAEPYVIEAGPVSAVGGSPQLSLSCSVYDGVQADRLAVWQMGGTGYAAPDRAISQVGTATHFRGRGTSIPSGPNTDGA